MSCTRQTQSPLARGSSAQYGPKKLGIARVVLFLVATALASSAQATFTNLADFDDTDGAEPYYVYLVQGTDGLLYGTAYSGGGFDGTGTVFKVTTGGTLTAIYTFCSLASCVDGDQPAGGLVLGNNGNFYGTTTNFGANGYGTVFEITPAGALTTLHSFDNTDGFQPYASMIQGSNGSFYGTTLYGGTNTALCSGLGCGTVFEITASGKFTSLHSFSGSDGQWPIGRLVRGANGNLYGTTTYGGTGGYGTIFEITAEGKLTTLHSFIGTEGGMVESGLVQDAKGNFYGTSSSGGDNSSGTVFELTPKNKLTTLYSFCALPACADGDFPYEGLIQATDGNFYGGTSQGGANNHGTVFEITPGGSVTTLYNFCSQPGCADGIPVGGGGLLQDTNGIFYGTTTQGGETNSYGTIFSISNGLSPFVETVSTSGKEGAKVGILGQGFSSSSVVKFGGTQATTVTRSGTTYLRATVPAAALTGFVTVTTGATSLTSPQTFKVTPTFTSFSPPSGPVGTPVTIAGTGLTQATKVTFNGTAASFNVNSDTQITATVPTGATTGKIAVTTTGGSATSTTSFTVN